MVEACVGLGSNLGDRRGHLRAALAEMRRAGRLLAVSPLYETEPVGLRDQPLFLNAVARLETELAARQLLEQLLDIEAERGRARREKDGPRTLDLDLLLYGDEVIGEGGIAVPHPRMHLRRFVLAPLAAVAPGWRHPLLGKTVEELLVSVEDRAGVAEVEDARWGADLLSPG
ncbi:MAG: 2-amino-4-hydroxy-6-hydroxymethyldihydropteridine diphosphokinase [Bryobacteraceae bacterium]